MAGFWARLFGVSGPSQVRLSTRVTTLENLCDDLDSRVEYLAAELKKVRGRQYSFEKRSQDPVEEEISEQPTADEPRPSLPTAHLARRFRNYS